MKFVSRKVLVLTPLVGSPDRGSGLGNRDRTLSAGKPTVQYRCLKTDVRDTHDSEAISSSVTTGAAVLESGEHEGELTLKDTGDNGAMFNRLVLTVLLICAISLFSLPNARAQGNERPGAATTGENVILQWNRVLQETIRTPGQQPPTIFPVRSFAMMHAAMFDAANSIDGTYTPYLVSVHGSRRASQDAAAAKAARDVLATLYPTRQSVYDAELAVSIEGIPWFRAWEGMRVGQIVAARMLEARANDGWNATPPPFVLPPTPGNWQPTPPANAPAAFTHFPP